MSRRYYIDFERPVVEMEDQLEELKKLPEAHKPDIIKEIKFLEDQITKLKKRVYKNLTAWQQVQMSRHPDRPDFVRYLDLIFDDFIELHGDRTYGDDLAVIGGLAKLGEQNIVVVGQEKGKDTHDRLRRNFGMPHPEGYRKAIRLFKLAGKFNLPLITIIDTPGAFAGVGAEERGQAQVIAKCLSTLSSLPTPTIAVNIGEGGSGGALAFGVCDRVFMLENAYYSVITPEGCAAILWQDKEKAPEAAEALALTAKKLLKMGIVDGVIKEPLGGAHRDPKSTAGKIDEILKKTLGDLLSKPVDELVALRYERVRQFGVFSDRQESEIIT